MKSKRIRDNRTAYKFHPAFIIAEKAKIHFESVGGTDWLGVDQKIRDQYLVDEAAKMNYEFAK